MAINYEQLLIQQVLGRVNMGSVFRMLARSKGRRDRVFFIFEGRSFTYGQTYEEAVRYARLFCYYRDKLVGEGRLGADDQLPVGVYMDNCPEYVFAFFGAAMSRAAIIGVNTGFRGETFGKVVSKAEVGLVLADWGSAPEVAHSLPAGLVSPEDVVVVGEGAPEHGYRSIEDALSDPRVSAGRELPTRFDNMSLLIVIYTSGTTGEPKGVPCSHIKLLGAAGLIWFRLKLGKQDRGYICMPMFHSNAWFIGILPLMIGGASFVLKPKFSASAFETDVLEHGVTYLNYVGQPIHYILVALEKKYGSPEAVEAALARRPENRFRIAHGNGASPVDREKMMRYLGMEHIYELYGSTEAPINTILKPGDPADSLGRLTSKKVLILNEHDQECPPAQCDASGRICNYEQAVGEIAKRTDQSSFIFSGYYKNPEATGKKFRDGYYRSGDLGHVRVIGGKRYLYFDGRTDDWIRKDGENFSAENVAQQLTKLPGVALAAAYGAPCAVADELVMAALLMHKGKDFDPQAAFDVFMKLQGEGGMDPKWMPDFIRIVDGFETTHRTEKILVRPLKRQHFNLHERPDLEVYYRERGDTTYRRLTADDFDRIKRSFEEMGRGHLLSPGM